MAGMTVTATRGGKKPLDAAVNLVPFIDLLSCCISFLLITAVWSQVARIDVVQRLPGRGDATQPEVPEAKLVLDLDHDGYVLSSSTGQRTVIANQGEVPDYSRLFEIMIRARQDYPRTADITMRAADQINYDAIARTIDVLLGASFPNVSLVAHGQEG